MPSDHRRQPGHGSQRVVCGVCTKPLFTLAVSDYAVPDLALRSSFRAEDGDVRAVDFISTRNPSSPFKQNIIPIRLKLDVLRAALLMNVFARNIFVHN